MLQGTSGTKVIGLKSHGLAQIGFWEPKFEGYRCGHLLHLHAHMGRLEERMAREASQEKMEKPIKSLMQVIGGMHER